MQFRTRAIHVGNEPDPQTGAVTTPIHLASTFKQHTAGEWREFDYSRTGNPTRKTFEGTLANLEGGCGALAYASGVAATHGVVLLLRSGDHIIAGKDIYGGTYRLLHSIAERAGITVSLVDTTVPENLTAAINERTKLLWLETPGNPMLSITDLAACVKVAKEKKVLVAVDNTFATPVLTRPLELGCDIVMHSATKYIGGHSDVLGGAIVARDPALFKELHFTQNATGAVMSPLESYLCGRGLKTLELRVREQCRSAMEVAEYLKEHPRVTKVFYPGLAEHQGHAVAAKQMQGGFGAMLSFEVDGDLDFTKHVCSSTKLFQLAVSLGSVESLISQPATMSHASYKAEVRRANGITDGLIRLSIGLEAVDDLCADLDEALKGK